MKNERKNSYSQTTFKARNEDEASEEFQIYCLEIFKNKKGVTGIEALEIFETKKVFDYLEKAYELLCSRGNSYIIAEIDEIIQRKK